MRFLTLFFLFMVLDRSYGDSNTTADITFNLTRLVVNPSNSLAAMAGLDPSWPWSWTYLVLGMQLVASGVRCRPAAVTSIFVPERYGDYSSFIGQSTADCTFDSLDGLSLFVDIVGNYSVANVPSPKLASICHDPNAAAIDPSSGSNTISICSDNFTATYSYQVECRDKHMYGPKCNVYCKNHTDDTFTCYTCQADGSKKCCAPIYLAPDCSLETTTAVTVPVNDYRDDHIWWILTIALGSLAGLLLLLLVIALIICCCIRARSGHNRTVYPRPAAVQTTKQVTTSEVTQVTERVAREPSNVTDTRSIRAHEYPAPQYRQRLPEPVYSEIRRTPHRPAPSIPRSPSIANTVSTVEIPIRDDPRRRPIIGTPTGLASTRHRVSAPVPPVRHNVQRRESFGSSDNEGMGPP